MNSTAHIYDVGVHCALGCGYVPFMRAYADRDRVFVKSDTGPIGADGFPMTLSCAIAYSAVRNFEIRLQRLFAGGAEDLKARHVDWKPMPLVLIVPRWLKGHPLENSLSAWIVENYADLFDDVATVADGETLGLYEVMRGLQRASEQARFCAVGAIDSYMDAELLDLLALNDRILKRGTPHGLVPSEACVLTVIGSEEGEDRRGPLGTIKSIFTGFETENPLMPKLLIGRGLAKPLRQAFETVQPHRFMVDMNGERWRSEDVGFSLSGARVSDDLLTDFETPLAQTGDCGAANGLILMALALSAPHRNDQDTPEDVKVAQADLSIISLSHLDGPRCVAVVETYSRQG